MYDVSRTVNGLYNDVSILRRFRYITILTVYMIACDGDLD